MQASLIFYITNYRYGVREEKIILDLNIEKDLLSSFFSVIPGLIMSDSCGFKHFNWAFKSDKEVVDMKI